MKKWKYEILADGKRTNEKIIAILDEKGHIDKVASAYMDRKHDFYRLYPTNYGMYSTISKPFTVSIYDVAAK